MLRSLLVAALFTLALPLQAGLVNQLGRHPSPYLAQHGEDPVAWQIWGEATLAMARESNKLLFISSGYFACHWCHVMQRESYQNPKIAALLNRHFIPVKIDRELQPALDAHLIEFVRRTRGNAGWPLNVFLTPEGYPLVGLTYAPPESFMPLLSKLQQLWQARPAELAGTARAASLALAAEAVEPIDLSTDAEALHASLVAMAISVGDDLEGGFGRQTRFPMAPQWSVLLARLAARPDQALRDLIELTLDQMASQGLRDQIGGGFFRYTVDPGWQVPHYEKMLYTQALLAQLYLRAGEVLQRPDYLEVARDTLDFTLARLQGEQGGFIASLSAVDPDDLEGGGYLWSRSQLAGALDEEELAFARRRWRLAVGPGGEQGWLPVDASSLEEMAREAGTDPDSMQSMEQRVRQKLLAARQVRNHPRDDKQLAAWNGLMLSALVDGARVLGDRRYRDAAHRLRDFLVTRLWDGERLLRARGPAGELGSAALEDYVYVAKGLSDWALLSGSDEERAFSMHLAREAWRLFYGGRGWQAGGNLLLPGIAAESAISDGPLPSPAALLIELTLGSEDPGDKPLAQRALQRGYQLASSQPLWYATQVAVTIRAADTAQRERP